jgi:hypothetical protein
VPDNPDGRSAPAASSATAAAGTAGIRVLPPAGAGDAGRVGKSANGRRPGGRRVGGSATSRAAPRGHRAAGGWDGSTGTARVRPPAEGSNTDAASVDQRSELWAAAVTVVHRQGWLVRLPPSALHPTSWMHMMIIQIQTAAYGTSKISDVQKNRASTKRSLPDPPPQLRSAPSPRWCREHQATDDPANRPAPRQCIPAEDAKDGHSDCVPDLLRQGRSESTAAKSYRLLRAILNTAVKDDRLPGRIPAECGVRQGADIVAADSVSRSGVAAICADATSVSSYAGDLQLRPLTGCVSSWC